MKDVTIIIPSYNHSAFILETLESIKNQTYKNYDVVIIDDNSTDNSVYIIKEFIEKNILDWQFIQCTQNNGIVKNLARVLAEVSTPYVSIVASDDVWLTDKIKNQIEYMNTNDDCSMIFTDYYEINENSEVVGEIHRSKRVYKYIDVLKGGDLPPASLLFRKKSLVDELDIIVDNVVEDLFIWLSCLKDNKSYAYVYPKCLVKYRLHNRNTAKKAPLKLLASHCKIIEYYTKNNKKSYQRYLPYWALRNFNYLARSNKREAIIYAKKALLLWYRPKFVFSMFKLIFLR